MATPSNDVEEKIKPTLIGLGEGAGYHPRKLLSAPILELFPKEWPQLMQVAACDELIRELESHVERPNHAAALRAALDIDRGYDSATLQDRLVAFRKDWHRKHPDFPLEIDLDNIKKIRDATRKWWESGRDQLARSLNSEIGRRNRTGWPQPSQESVDRIKAAILDSAQSAEALPREDQPTLPRGYQLRRRRRFFRQILTTVVVILVLVVVAFVWFGNRGKHGVTAKNNTAAATCADVGNDSRGVLDPTWDGPFRAAYQEAGGKAKLGCPRTDDPSGFVHPWGAGTSQDLQGDRSGKARIMALDPEHVIVMAGTFWQDYTDLGSGHPNPNAAQEEGYPTSNPFTCGSAKFVLLASSQHDETPGAMVTAAHSVHFIWLPKLIWLAYKAVGGPFGALGQPTGQEQQISAGIRQPFEHGEITRIGNVVRAVNQHGHAVPINLKAVASLESCISKH